AAATHLAHLAHLALPAVLEGLPLGRDERELGLLLHRQERFCLLEERAGTRQVLLSGLKARKLRGELPLGRTLLQESGEGLPLGFHGGHGLHALLRVLVEGALERVLLLLVEAKL